MEEQNNDNEFQISGVTLKEDNLKSVRELKTKTNELNETIKEVNAIITKQKGLIDRIADRVIEREKEEDLDNDGIGLSLYLLLLIGIFFMISAEAGVIDSLYHEIVSGTPSLYFSIKKGVDYLLIADFIFLIIMNMVNGLKVVYIMLKGEPTKSELEREKSKLQIFLGKLFRFLDKSLIIVNSVIVICISIPILFISIDTIRLSIYIIIICIYGTIVVPFLIKQILSSGKTWRFNTFSISIALISLIISVFSMTHGLH